jgi:hypothetical protein
VKVHKLNVSPFAAGVAVGVGAALVQAYFKVIPPNAYGVCMVCHPKDLVNWIADHLFGTDWGYSVASDIWPLLTVVGLSLGALVAARQNGELRLRSSRQPLFFFVNGFLMINFGLILGSCPIRVILLTAYGSLTGIVGWVCVIVGVLAGILFLRWNAHRITNQKGNL